MKEVVIVDAVRTPIGRYKGALKTFALMIQEPLSLKH